MFIFAEQLTQEKREQYMSKKISGFRWEFLYKSNLTQCSLWALDLAIRPSINSFINFAQHQVDHGRGKCRSKKRRERRMTLNKSMWYIIGTQKKRSHKNCSNSSLDLSLIPTYRQTTKYKNIQPTSNQLSNLIRFLKQIQNLI